MTEAPSEGSTRSGGTEGGELGDVVPKPAVVSPTDAEYRLTGDTPVVVDRAAARPVGEYLADLLAPATGFAHPVETGAGSTDGISLRIDDGAVGLGDEGYELAVTDAGISLRADAAAGLFAGVQTLRQLLPAAIESDAVEPGPWTVPGGEIRDAPRFDYRGAHLDVARHFFDVDEVKRYVDHMALYKLNHLHLHLTDDQGWRIEIESWPKLTEVGGSTEVGGGDGGYYTRAEYEELVAYAADRFVTVVPEIDVPGHTNAALASYGELNPDGEPADPYSGRDVGFSTLRLETGATEAFLEDVVREVAALTPGPYLHVGGDEATELSTEEYAAFVEHVCELVAQHGKRPVGWQEVLAADLPASATVQFWFSHDDPDHGDEAVAAATADGREFVLSPARHAYLDMKYDPETELGLDWAGQTSVADAYDWDPGSYVAGVDETAVRGVEAAVWSETLETFADVEYMAFPRLPAIAERGWTPEAETGWEGFRHRLAGEGPRWERLGIEFHRSPEIPWVDETA